MKVLIISGVCVCVWLRVNPYKSDELNVWGNFIFTELK